MSVRWNKQALPRWFFIRLFEEQVDAVAPRMPRRSDHIS